jgi:plastocyanin domain-containing protein
MIEKMGGTVKVKSVEGVGTQFTVELSMLTKEIDPNIEMSISQQSLSADNSSSSFSIVKIHNRVADSIVFG